MSMPGSRGLAAWRTDEDDTRQRRRRAAAGVALGTLRTDASSRAERAPAAVAASRGAAASRGTGRRHALTALAVVLAIGAVVAVLDFRAAVHAGRDETVASTRRTAEIVRGSAAEAAYQLNAELARHVVEGLLADEAIASAALADNFGQTLAQNARATFAADEGAYTLPLWYDRTDGTRERVGSLSLKLASDTIDRRVHARAWSDVVAGLARLLAGGAVILAVLHLRSRRPADARVAA